MEKYIEKSFKPEDSTLEQLVAARREEVVRLQTAQAEQTKDLESRGQERLKSLRSTLPKEIATTVDHLDKTHAEATASTKAHVERIQAKMRSSRCLPQYETAMHPGLAGGQLIAPNSLGWFTPY